MLNNNLAAMLQEDADFRADSAIAQVKVEDRLWYGERYGVRLTAPKGCAVTFGQLLELARSILNAPIDHVHTVETLIGYYGEPDSVESCTNQWMPFVANGGHAHASSISFDVDHPTSGEIPDWRELEIEAEVRAAIAAARTKATDRRIALLMDGEWVWLEHLDKLDPQEVLRVELVQVIRENSLVTQWGARDWIDAASCGSQTILWEDEDGWYFEGRRIPGHEYRHAMAVARAIAQEEREFLPERELEEMKDAARRAIQAATQKKKRALYARVKAGRLTIGDISVKTGWCSRGIAGWLGIEGGNGYTKIGMADLVRASSANTDYQERLNALLAEL